MKNLKTGNYTEFRDISDGLHRPQYDKFRLCKGLYKRNTNLELLGKIFFGITFYEMYHLKPKIH